MLSNAQSELLPLEVGMHPLGSGTSIREYVKMLPISATLHAYQRQAAEVFTRVNTLEIESLSKRWRALAEIHAAPRWRSGCTRSAAG